MIAAARGALFVCQAFLVGAIVIGAVQKIDIVHGESYPSNGLWSRPSQSLQCQTHPCHVKWIGIDGVSISSFRNHEQFFPLCCIVSHFLFRDDAFPLLDLILGSDKCSHGIFGVERESRFLEINTYASLFHGQIPCRRSPAILPNEINPMDVVSTVNSVSGANDWVSDCYKRPCRSLKKADLPSQGRRLVGQGMELPLHDGQLLPENASSYDAYDHKGSGENADAPSPSRHYQIAIGLLLLAATYAAVLIAFKGAEYADYRWPALWWLPLLGGLVLAGWLAVHTLNYLAG